MNKRVMAQAQLLADKEKPHPPKYGSRHHLTMLRVYGEMAESRCKECSHLARLHYNHRVLKCGKMNWTNSDATDWRAGWQACGLFETAQANKHG